MAGNQYGWGNQPGWGAQPPGYPGYPGYPPPQRRGGLRLWHFLVGGGVLLLLMFIACAGGGVWMIASRMGGDEVSSSIPDMDSPLQESDDAPHASIAPIDRSEARIVPSASSRTGGASGAKLPRGVRPLLISAASSVRTAGVSGAATPAAPPEVRTIGWRVTVDPPSTTAGAITSGSSSVGSVIDKFAAPANGRIEQVNWPWPQLVVSVSGTFNRRSVRVHQIWDLTTGKGIAAFPLERLNGRNGSLLAISPDGTRVAVQAKGTGDQFVTVASLKNGAVEKTIQLEFNQPQWLRFVGADRLMAGGSSRGNSKQAIEIHPIGEGQVVKIDDERVKSVKEFALSHGGKYLATPSNQNQNVLVFETASGTLAGEVQFTFESGSPSVSGLAFSPNGGQLACLLNGNQNVKYLAAVDIARGEGAFSHVVSLSTDYSLRNNNGSIPSLQFLADGRRCLLLGSEVFDCATGANVEKPLEGRLETSTVYFNGQQRAQPTLNGAWVYGNRLLFQSVSQNLASVELSGASDGGASDGDASPSAVATAADGTDLPLTPIDTSGAENVSAAAPSAWNVPLESPALVKSPAHLSLPSNKGASFFGGSSGGAEAGNFNSICFGPAPVTTLLLTRYVEGYHTGSRQVYRYDIGTGLPFSPFPLPRACDLAGLNAAKQVLTINRADESRVDVWSAVDGAHLRGWRPFEGRAGDGGKIAWADFAADGKVLTLSKGGELICWANDAPRAVYRRQVSALGEPVMNSSKTWLVCYDGRAVTVIDAQTGHSLGAIPLPGVSLSECVLRGDDRMLAGIAKLHDRTVQLCVFDLSTGSIVFRFAPSNPIEAPVWFGDHHLLVNRGALIDLNEGLQVWTFPLAQGTQLGGSGGCLWLLEKEGIAGCKLADLPTGRRLIEAFAPGATPLFSPGDEVAFSGSSDFEPFLKTCLDRSGYRRSEAAPRKLRVSVGEHSTGEEFVYGSGFFPRVFGPRSGDVVVSEVHLKTRVELVGPSGGVAWSTEYTTPMPSSVRSKDARGDIHEAIRATQRERCVAGLGSVQLPRYVIQVDGEPIGLPGVSTLAEELSGAAAE